MTGVEKVREWAEETVEDVNGDHWPRCACLAYGAYLRGLIEVWREWYDSENCGGYDRDNSRAACRMAIAAWKEVVNAEET